MKISKGKLLTFSMLVFTIQAFANSIYTPPFYDADVQPHGNIIVHYKLKQNLKLLCFGINNKLIATWKFKNSMKTNKLPILLNKANADIQGDIIISNEGNTNFEWANCQYQAT